MQATAALPKDLHRRGVHAPGRDRDGPVEVGIPGRRVWDRPRERARGATFLIWQVRHASMGWTPVFPPPKITSHTKPFISRSGWVVMLTEMVRCCCGVHVARYGRHAHRNGALLLWCTRGTLWSSCSPRWCAAVVVYTWHAMVVMLTEMVRCCCGGGFVLRVVVVTCSRCCCDELSLWQDMISLRWLHYSRAVVVTSCWCGRT